MCGIIAGQSPEISSRHVNAALEVISARGPDANKTVWLENYAFLSFNLLGISSTNTDKLIQPLHVGNLHVCVNGEIYNHRDLKTDLVKKGAIFKSDSDCEVVLHGLQIYGKKFLERLNGEFAIVAYWKDIDEWMCAVDHVGTKPLRYVNYDNKFLVASSSAALKELGVNLQLDSASCLFSMHTHCLPSGSTIFKDIKSIPPGHYIEVRNGNVKISSYKSISFVESDDIEYLLNLAVDIRVPEYFKPALTLSGGIDSCIIALLLQRQGTEFDCYSIDFPGSAYSEIDDINIFCKKYGLKTTVVSLSETDIMSLYPTAVINSENMSINPHAAGKLKINKVISQAGHRVCFTGDGADELFFGYSHFHTNDQYQFLRDSTTIGFQFSQLVKPEYRQQLLSSNLFNDYSSIDNDPSVQDLYYHYWLNEYGLKILGDSQSSNESIEYRYPFLDGNLISNIKKKENLRELNFPSKQLLRNIIEDKDLASRTKRPFTAPFIGKAWMSLFEEYVFGADLIVLDNQKVRKYISTIGNSIGPSSVLLSQILSLGIIKKDLCND